jgi:hypothetical protein
MREAVNFGVEMGVTEGLELALSAAVPNSASFVAQSLGTLGGVVTIGVGAKNVRHAVKFDVNEIYSGTWAGWDRMLKNIDAFRVAITNAKYNGIEDSFRGKILDELNVARLS